MVKESNVQGNIDFSQKQNYGRKPAYYPPVIYSTRDQKTCIICGKATHPKEIRKITGYCKSCLFEYLKQHKPRCKDCGGEISVNNSERCWSCAMKKRKRSAHFCVSCGIQLKQRTTKRCRPCWFKELSKAGAAGRIAAGRAMKWKSGRFASKIEIRAGELLDYFGLKWRRQVPISRWIIDYIVDEKKAAIEVHGVYWHSQERTIQRDQVKREYLEKHGYKVIFLKEENIHFWWKTIQDLLKS